MKSKRNAIPAPKKWSDYENFRVIKAEYFGPTNSRGSKVILTELTNRLKCRIHLAPLYDENDQQTNCSLYTAAQHLAKLGINYSGHSCLDSGPVLIYSDSWAGKTKGGEFIKINGKLS